MLRIRNLLILFGLSLGLASPAAAGYRTPEDVVRAIYAQYGVGRESDKNGLNLSNAKAIFDPSLFNLYQTAANSGALDFDFFVQGQDFNLAKPIEINNSAPSANISRVNATLTQNWVGQKPRVDKFIFSMVRGKDGWRLHDAISHGSSVRQEWIASIKEGRGPH